MFPNKRTLMLNGWMIGFGSDISRNNLSGTIPTCLGALGLLARLDFSQNSFTGKAKMVTNLSV
jgi:hypothetical protein